MSEIVKKRGRPRKNFTQVLSDSEVAEDVVPPKKAARKPSKRAAKPLSSDDNETLKRETSSPTAASKFKKKAKKEHQGIEGKDFIKQPKKTQRSSSRKSPDHHQL